MKNLDITDKPWPKYPIGTSFFPNIIAEGNEFADKSLLIEDIVKCDAQVILFTRARRWIKSSNMSMCQHFFSEQVIGQPTADLFRNLKISKVDNGEFLKRHQGKYPVIFINFKTINSPNFQAALLEIGTILSNLFEDFEYLLESKTITSATKQSFREILTKKADFSTLASALLILTKALYLHFNKKVFILVDEYDHPLNLALSEGYYKEMKEFLRGLYGACLKDNPYLEKGVMTGILRIAKAGIFSQLNNLAEYSMLDSRFSEHFGFTEEELEHLMAPVKARLSIEPSQIRNWYNGYRIGNRIIYNPWSIMRCLSEKGDIQSYWVDVSENNLIESKLRQSDETVKSHFEQLLQGTDIEVPIDFYINMDPNDNTSDTLWTLLLHSGYLTLSENNVLARSPGKKYRVCIPNLEVKQFYLNTFNKWFKNCVPSGNTNAFLEGLLTGDMERFTENLSSYLMNSFSYFDTGGRNSENVYHAFVLGLIANLHKHYIIKSNRESGHGRFDILLIPHDKRRFGILFEFKSINRKSKLSTIQSSTQKALEQIKEQHYVSELNLHDIKNRLFIAITFAGKNVDVLFEKEVASTLTPVPSLFLHSDFEPEATTQKMSPNHSPVRQLSHFSQYVYRTFGSTVGIRRQAVGNFQGEDIRFDIFRTGGAGHCGFYSLPIPYDRAGVVGLLLDQIDNEVIRKLVADEIIELAISHALPLSLIQKYSIIQEYMDYQATMDESKALLLRSVLDQIDPARTLLNDYNFENVLGYLNNLSNRNPLLETAFTELEQFKNNYDTRCAEFRLGFSTPDIYGDFVKLHLGGSGHLSFSRGGLNFERQTSSLDAILLAMRPAIRLTIWHDDLHDADRLQLAYHGGPIDGTPTHVHHQGGLDSHFELMAESQRILDAQHQKGGESKRKKHKTDEAVQRERRFWSSAGEREEQEDDNDDIEEMNVDEDDEHLEEKSI